MSAKVKKEFSYFSVMKCFRAENFVCLFLLLLNSVLNILYPYYIQQLIDLGIGNADQNQIIFYSVMMLFTIVLSVLTGYISKTKFVVLGQKISFFIRKKIFEYFERYTVGFFDKQRMGDVTSVLENDVRNLQTLYTYLISDFISNAIVLTGIILIMVRMDALITGSIVVVVVFCSWIQKRWGNLLRKESIALSKVRGDVQTKQYEFLTGYCAIRDLNKTDYFSARTWNEYKKMYGAEMKTAKIKLFAKNFGFLFQNLCLVFVFIYGGFNVMQQNYTVGVLFSLTMYVQRLFSPIRSLFDLYMEIKKNQASLQRIDSLTGCAESYVADGTKEYPQNEKGIVLTKLTFGYGEKKIFKDFELQINKGDKVAVLGSNGRGKTTLIRLLLKSLNGYEGEVKIGDLNVLDISNQHYRKSVIGLSQKVMIFSGTVYENITMFNNTISEYSAVEALKQVGLYEEISNLPLGINTMLGGNGIALSSGQEQRLHLARVFVLEPEVLILDEPTSALDSQSEVLVYENLFSKFKDKTILVITHRKKAISYCNRIINLDDWKMYE